jgi:NADH/NAD ratio-sensing transcriptional regulator Rex
MSSPKKRWLSTDIVEHFNRVKNRLKLSEIKKNGGQKICEIMRLATKKLRKNTSRLTNFSKIGESIHYDTKVILTEFHTRT